MSHAILIRNKYQVGNKFVVSIYFFQIFILYDMAVPRKQNNYILTNNNFLTVDKTLSFEAFSLLQYHFSCLLAKFKCTTRNLLMITFAMSCQHFPPKHIFKFLINQYWKLIQRCCLKVSLYSLSPFFQHMHRSMSTLKFGHSRKHV